jgi:ABC-type antimicrobial peptide transport system permease subunit
MREVAVRQALGAPRTWAVWQVMNESILLFVVGGGCSLGLSLFLNRAIRHFAGHSVDFLKDIHLDWTVFLYSGLLCLVSALISGIVPVF